LQKKEVSYKFDNKIEHYGRQTVAGLMTRVIYKSIGMQQDIVVLGVDLKV